MIKQNTSVHNILYYFVVVKAISFFSMVLLWEKNILKRTNGCIDGLFVNEMSILLIITYHK